MCLKMILRQTTHRWQVAVLLWLAMTALVSLYVYVENSARFSNRSMQLIMKNMGQNLLVLPKSTEPLDTYLCTDRQAAFSENVTDKMAQRLELDSKYYVSVLQEKIALGGTTVVLTGIKPTDRSDETKEKTPLIAPIPCGHTKLGARSARLLGLSRGDSLKLGPRSLDVVEVLTPQGSPDDYRVYVSLSDAQDFLRKPGRINVIWAFLCMHRGSLSQVMHRQRELMAKLFPDLQVVAKTRIARGRDMARRTTSGYLRYLLALVLGITVVIIALTGLQEVSERRREIGILLAMGTTYAYIVSLYVAKLFVVALLASVTGFLVGSCLSRGLLSSMLVTHTQPVTVIWSQLPVVTLLTCLVAVLAASVPMAKLVRLDPNAILTEE